MTKRPRYCPRCKAPVEWKRHRPEGARCSRFVCLTCGTNTKPITLGKRKPKRVSEYKRLMAQAEKLCRAIVMARDGNRCVICGSTVVVQWAHLLSRGYHAIRCDPDNSVALCKAHHCYYTWRKEEWRDWCEERLGAEMWAALNARRGMRWRVDDWRVTILDLQGCGSRW